MIRFLAVLVGIAAAFAGSYGAFLFIQAVGPEDRTGDYGYGDAARVPPGGGTLFEARNFARVKAALVRELGADGALQSLTVQPGDASAMARVGDTLRYVDIDASGRSQSRDGDRATPAATVPVSRLDPEAVEKLVLEAAETANVGVERLSLQGNSRDWNVDMLDGGEPDQFVVNLDGSGLRLSGEPNPSPVGAEPDSLLRRKNLEKVLKAVAAETSPDASVTSLDIRPDRVSFQIDQEGRTLALDYGYDAQLTYRDLRATAGAPVNAISLADIDPRAPERMANTAKRAVDSKGLGDIQYVLLNTSSGPDSDPTLSLYRTAGSDPLYLVADLHGRHLTWPGRS